MREPRGIRNKNPFNLRLSYTEWQGQIEGKDKDFCVFKSMEYGLRAGLVNLYNGYFKEGLTIRELINKYAPSSENDTESYIRRVSAMSGVDPGVVPDQDEWLSVASEILKYENGQNVATPEELKNIARSFNLWYYV